MRTTFGQHGAHSRRPRHVRTQERGIRRRWVSIVLFVGAFVLASGSAALAYVTTSGSGTGAAQAVTLQPAGAGAAANPTPTSLTLSWGASPGLPSGGGYLVLRSSTSGGPYAKVSSGTCDQTITLVSAATVCTDSGLTAGTTYYYEIEAGYYDVNTLWVSSPDTQFSGATSQASSGPVSTGVGASNPTSPSPGVTSANSTSFSVGTQGTFQVTASGSPAPTFSNTASSGCTPSTLPTGVTFSSTGLLSGTPGADAAWNLHALHHGFGCSPGQFIPDLHFDDHHGKPGHHIAGGFRRNVEHPESRTDNRGPSDGFGCAYHHRWSADRQSDEQRRRRERSGSTQFSSTPLTSVIIPSGQSSTTFWYGSDALGSPTITASALAYVAGTQQETITTAPAGLGIALGTGSTGSPVISCGAPGASSTCTVTGVGPSGHVVVAVAFGTRVRRGCSTPPPRRRRSRRPVRSRALRRSARGRRNRVPTRHRIRRNIDADFRCLHVDDRRQCVTL